MQTGFQNPMWVPGRLEWDFTDPDEFKFYWRGCGSVSFIRVPNSFELNEQTRMTFIGHNYTRLIQVDGIDTVYAFIFVFLLTWKIQYH